jgi:hypothetical protein
MTGLNALLLFAVMVVSWVVTFRLIGGQRALAALFDAKFTAEKMTASVVAMAITISTLWLLGGFSN